MNAKIDDPIFEGLPSPNPTTSYWQSPPHELADHRTTTSLPESSKYVIIGSGITGTLVAWKLLSADPGASITMLEARQACSGATGRNGGWCRAGRYVNFKRDLEQYGLSEALKLEALEENTVANLTALVQELHVKCDLRAVETVDIACVPRDWEELKEVLRLREEVCGPGGSVIPGSSAQVKRIYSAEEAQEELLIPAAVGAVGFRAWVLSPYKLVCGLLQRCLESSPDLFNLQTNTAVVKIEKQEEGHGGKWIVKTADRGIMRADRVILATNAYTAKLYPALRHFIIPTRAQIGVVRPGDRIEGDPVLSRSWAVDTEVSGDYYHSRAEGFTGAGDIICGGGRRLADNAHGKYKAEQPILDDSEINEKISQYQTKSAALHFGKENWGQRGGEVLMQWTGIMAYTQDQQPLVGQAPGNEGLWICAGFHGHGMALTERSAEALVEMVVGRQEVEEWLPRSYRLERIFPGNHL